MKKLGFVLEHSLGHVTHAQNLRRVLASDPSVQPFYLDIPYHETPGWQSKLPGVRSNWSVRASLAAYRGLRPFGRTLDAILFHTQVTSLFSVGLMRRVPSVISLDATPAQYDALGAFYGHAPSGNVRLELLKKRINMRAYDAASHLVSWSEWTKQSLVTEYGVSPAKISVIPPGIDTEAWDCPVRKPAPGTPVSLLFVGGDFARKGGETLLAAFQSLPPSLNVHLHIVTQTAGVGDGLARVTVHRGVTPNSDALRRLYAGADVFVFPTQGDCLPLAVMEALASGLPVITTNVGALAEAVTHGETGLVVPAGDESALLSALSDLIDDPVLRARMGRQAREVAHCRFQAAHNYGKLVEVVRCAGK